MFGGFVERYEGELGGGGDPRLEEYVDVGSDRYWEDLFELLQVDIDLRTRRGEDVGVWKYLVRFPGLEGHVAWVAKLLELEVTWRRELGLPVNWKEYWDKYPSWRDKLGEMFWAWDLVVPEIPGYDLRPVIAKGGMGAVFSAWDRKFEREVAIKVMKPGMPEEAFQRESRVTARLQHPGIPPVHDRGKLAEGLPYLVMKLIQGETLEVILQKQNRQGLQAGMGNLLAVFERICQAVGYAHSQGVIHRDLKPFNVMVGSFGEVQVMDWGLSRESSSRDGDERLGATATDEAALTVTGQVKGTPAYMAPEQARGEVVDPRADVFALGGILLAILTGRPPFDGGGSDEMVARAAKSDLGDALDRLQRADADPELRELCRQCLAPAPDDRPVDGTQLAEAVGAYRATLEERLKQTEMNRVRDVEQRKRHKTQRALAATALLLAIAASLAIIVASLWQSAEINKADAIHQRDLADNARQLVEMEREKLALYKVCGTIRSVQSQLAKKNIEEARKYLNSIEPNSRKWEWHYLNRICNPFILNIECPDKKIVFAEFNADGTRITTRFEDKSEKEWDAGTGKELMVRSRGVSQGYEGSPTEGVFAYSHDRKRILTGRGSMPPVIGEKWECGAKVRDSENGNCIVELKGHSRPLRTADFSADGKRIVTGSDDGTIKIWDAMTGQELLTLKGKATIVTSVKFSPDGAKVVSGELDLDERIEVRRVQAKVWDAKTGETLRTLQGHKTGISSASFSPNSSSIITTSHDMTAKVWDTTTGNCLLNIDGHKTFIESATFSPDSSRVVTVSREGKGHDVFGNKVFGTLNLWDLNLKKRIFSLSEYSPSSAKFVPGGIQLITIGNKGKVSVLDSRIDAQKMILKTDNDPIWMFGHIPGIFSFFSPDGNRIIARNHRSVISIYDANAGKFVGSIKESPDLKMSIWGPENKIIKSTENEDGVPIVSPGLAGNAIGLSTKTNGEQIIWSGLKAWSTLTWTEIPLAKRITDDAVFLSFSPDFKRVAKATRNGQIIVWDVENTDSISPIEIKAELNGFGNGDFVLEELTDGSIKTTPAEAVALPFDLKSLHFSPDGLQIIAVRENRNAKVYKLNSGSELFEFDDCFDLVAASYSADGSRIVTGSNDGIVKVWDARAGSSLLSFKAHEARMTKASISADGSRIATASLDGTLKIWDAIIGEEILNLQARPNYVYDREDTIGGLQKIVKPVAVCDISFSPDGTRVMSANEDGTVTVWDSRPVQETQALDISSNKEDAQLMKKAGP